jgi:hypothetical protein
MPASKRAEIAALHPLRRLGITADVAAAALFLASNNASWVRRDAGYRGGGPDALTGSSADYPVPEPQTSRTFVGRLTSALLQVPIKMVSGALIQPRL